MIAALEDRIGYCFANKHLLTQALTHSSYVNTIGSSKIGRLHASNERLEFLGDAVLQMCISDYLFRREPDMSEGQLSHRRAGLVCETTLAQIARSIDLGSHLILGLGERKKDGHEKSSILADALEAVLGAVFLDSGMASAVRVVHALYEPLAYMPAALTMQQLNNKSALQQHFQRTGVELPQYKVVDEQGVDHLKEFTVAVFYGDKQIGIGSGASKKIAEQNAAHMALEGIRQASSEQHGA